MIGKTKISFLQFKQIAWMALALFLIQPFQSIGQSAMGEWTLHVPAREALGVVAHNKKVYAAFLSGVLLYDEETKEKSLLTSVNALSDVAVSTIGYEPISGTVIVGYENGNLDLLTDNRTDNIPFIKLSSLQGLKTILRIVCRNGKVYAATGFGIVVIDPVKREVKETYYPTETNDAIQDIAFLGDTIFALTNNKMCWAKINNPALADYNQWTVDNRVPNNAVSTYKDIEIINNDFFLSTHDDAYSTDTIYTIQASGIVPLVYPTTGLELNSLSNTNNHLTINTDGGVFIYNDNLDGYSFGYNVYPFGSYVNATSSYMHGTDLYIADRVSGLTKLGNDFSLVSLSFDGPPKNSFYAMDWYKGKLAVAGGGLNGKKYTFNNSGCYTLEDGKWDLYAREVIKTWDTANLYDCLALSINPTNPDEFAIGTYSDVPLSTITKDKVVTNLFDNSNSPIALTSLGNGHAFISDVKYDEEGNLWMVNGYCDKVLKVFTANKDWYSFDLGSSSYNGYTGKMAIDYNKNVWLSVDGKGLFGFDHAGTIDNPSDDRIRQIVKSDLSENLPSNSVRAIAVDFDNEIWIGTDEGFAIIYNSESVFSSSTPQYVPQRIKVDFEGNVEYLLGSTAINDIEVDGGNRKWMATDGAGVFLLSPDGLTVLANYTVENSDLISNSVMDLEINHTTGEVYMVTDKGLISLRTDASYEDAEYSDVRVFPNPVQPDFSGVITIQGIRYNSDVKITDMGGNLVYKTTSNGGTAIWNGKTLNGEKVASGVYLIWTAANDGKGRKVGKVAIINE